MKEVLCYNYIFTSQRGIVRITIGTTRFNILLFWCFVIDGFSSERLIIYVCSCGDSFCPEFILATWHQLVGVWRVQSEYCSSFRSYRFGLVSTVQWAVAWYQTLYITCHILLCILFHSQILKLLFWCPAGFQWSNIEVGSRSWILYYACKRAGFVIQPIIVRESKIFPVCPKFYLNIFFPCYLFLVL